MHIEDASARIVVRNALFWGRERVSALTIPWCTYTDPEIAHVGLYVREAIRHGIPVKTFTVPMHDVDRAVADGEEEGFVKIHIKEGTDQIIGATVVARHAGEIINNISLAICSHIGLRRLAQLFIPIQHKRAQSRWLLIPTTRRDLPQCAGGCSGIGWNYKSDLVRTRGALSETLSCRLEQCRIQL